jgi:predicted nucleotidyltransferase
MSPITTYHDDIRRLCGRYGIARLSAFGSVLTDRFSDDSDIDLIVGIDDSDPLTYSDKYFNLKFALERLMGRPIDLLEERGQRNPLLKAEIDRTKVLLYGN